MNISTFEQWVCKKIEQVDRLATEPDYTTEITMVTCPDCRGEGFDSSGHDCDCSYCDRGEEDCVTCCGLGEVDFSSITKDEVLDVFTYEKYLEEVCRDLILRPRWEGKPDLHHMIELGMAPFTHMKTDRHLRLVSKGILKARSPNGLSKAVEVPHVFCGMH